MQIHALLLRRTLSFVQSRKLFLLLLATSVPIYFLCASLLSKIKFAKVLQCSELPRRFPDSIPPLVHWTSKNGRVPAKLIPLLKSWRKLADIKLNTSYEQRNSTADDGFLTDRWHFMHWDDKQISDLVARHYPRLATAYNKLINGLERSDIGRLVILHHVGGLYVDTDVELLRDPTPLLRPSQLQGVGMSPNFSCDHAVWSQEPPEHPVFLFNISSMISNAVMMSRANHSFLSFVLNNWPQWFEANWAKKKKRLVVDAVYVTGPLMLQSFYKKYISLQGTDRPEDWCSDLLAEADTLQPIWDAAWLPQYLKTLCKKPDKLMEIQQQHCKRLNLTKFKTKQIPNDSYTVHRFMHLSYKVDYSRMVGSVPISSVLSIERCYV